MSTSPSETSDAPDGDPFEDCVGPRVSVTHFLSLPIRDEEVVGNLTRTMEIIREKHPIVERFVIHPAKYHISVAVLGLGEETHHAKALELLKGPIKAIVDEYCAAEPLRVTVKGIEDFRRTVVYADLEGDEDKARVVEMCNKIRDLLRANAIPMIASSEFIPHLTLLKLSAARKGSLRRFPDKVYFEFADQLFGTETIASLDLCELKALAADQYYSTAVTLPFVKPPAADTHSPEDSKSPATRGANSQSDPTPMSPTALAAQRFREFHEPSVNDLAAFEAAAAAASHYD